jgi:hypothetical protein
MPLTANPIPSVVPTFALPVDRQAMLADSQVLTATGFLNNVNSGLIDLGGTISQPSGAGAGSGVGRFVTVWALNILAMDFASNDERYQFALIGSNDIAFGNGNVELLAFHDFCGVTTFRLYTPLLGGSPNNFPIVQAIPFTNLMQKIVYRYLKCQVVIAGTSPSVTVTSWIVSPALFM